MGGHADGLRDAVVGFFANTGAEWEFRVQLCTDLDQMPIEDASVRWPEALSPYVTVARIVAAPQLAWSEARSAAIDDGMAFSPWHGIAAHRPICRHDAARPHTERIAMTVEPEANGIAVAKAAFDGGRDCGGCRSDTLGGAAAR